ncbi:hypothetical protein [Candidatus Uabimicrobium sp. HlEnr_7]|uniref:hypothetical protein n=1 Tax=Candidatus Uabimicrobium helgolandensis TaxID=3095367 RepID=UPI003555C38F
MRAFIAMPFAEQFNSHWQTIQKVCKELQVETYRVDTNLSYERHIDLAIQQEIKNSHFVIAILTGDSQKHICNPNVAYEVGYAQGIEKETILLVEEPEMLSFDLKQQRTCLYRGDMEKLREGLTAEMNFLKKKLSDKYTEKIKKFSNEVERCLRIVLPFKYRMFGKNIGVVESKIIYNFYFYKDKYLASHGITVSGEENPVSLCSWLGYIANKDERRDELRQWLKSYDGQIRGLLGYDTSIYYEANNIQKSMGREYEFLHENIVLDEQRFGTAAALQIALRLRTYIETMQPLYDKFLEEKNMLVDAKPKYQ